MRRAVLLALGWALAGTGAAAHPLDPAYLEVEALDGDAWRAVWRVPQAGSGRPLPLIAVLPEACEPRRPPALAPDGAAFGAAWIARCPGGLRGGTVAVEGLDRTGTDALVRLRAGPGEVEVLRLTSASPTYQVPAPRGALGTLSTFAPLGVRHILGGLDHLALTLALVLLVPDRRRLVGTITAFTLAHALTLAAAVLGWVVAPPPAVEATVALAIVLLAAELARPRGARALEGRRAWALCLTLGLLHGLGFATALTGLGLLPEEVPLALLAFNLGVEAGQLGFVLLVLHLLALLGSQLPPIDPARARHVLAYAMGGAGAAALIARSAAL